jgi:low affinity Fe/Cu permease
LALQLQVAPSATFFLRAKDDVVHAFNRQLEKFSVAVTNWAGSSWAFAFAACSIVLWALSGPFFNFSETWQLVVNTSTTIVTFLMVFLIQRSQNKESLAVQVKLNELLASQKGASNRLINVEDMSEEDISVLHERFAALSSRLEEAADDCDVHSVAEAADAVQEVQEELKTKKPLTGKSARHPKQPARNKT